ncbi:MAG: penicillin-binding protein 2 [Solirubrobacterales bacterium]|nr:penicillin-binding protein 2 [Solirubrobacterales bacterium]
MRIEPVIPRPRKKRSLPSRRFAVIGAVGLILLGILFFRLWSLQIVTGDKYLAEANQNRTREVRVPAPRGRILDRDGNVLVDNRTSMALQLDPIEIPTEPAERRELFTRVGEVLGNDADWVRRKYLDSIENDPPGSPITLDRDVDDDIVYYLQEHQAEFPEVQVNRIFVRKYPQGLLAAHILGSIGEVTAEDLEENPDKDLAAGDTLGKTGIEQTYDDELRGSPGDTRLQVDSTGRIVSQLPSTMPDPGDSIRLSINEDVQVAGETSLQSIGLPGAFVAMDVNNGQVLGLGSNPTFDPSIFTRPLTQKQVDDLYDEDLGAPLFDRAIGGQYPVGSIFKPITALAGLDGGYISPSDVVNDAGTITIADQEFDNAGKQAHGPVDLRRSLEVSSDVYYYLLGADMNGTRQLQDWAGNFGLGKATGIDIPGESEGLVPTPKWLNEAHKEEPDYYDPWVIGQNIQFAIGQGYFQASPLQMAVAYSALGNGGSVLKPQLYLQTEDAAGRVLKEAEPEVVSSFEMDPAYRQDIMDGLHDAAQAPEGTSYKVFGGFPVKVAGKTGTAERQPKADQAWYAALAPADNPEIAVIVTVEEGGFGADTAAPVALQILQAYFDKQAKAVSGGTGSVE